MRGVGWIAAISILLPAVPLIGEQQNEVGQMNPNYLTWTSAQAQQIGRSTRVKGRAGGTFDFRGAHTERSYNYIQCIAEQLDGVVDVQHVLGSVIVLPPRVDE
jgi:hypothetical protein